MIDGQEYVSQELTHFVGRALEGDEARFALMLEIIRSGRLTHHPKSSLRRFIDTRPDDEGNIGTACVCFCDIPLSQMEIHKAKYSRFGIAFSKAFVCRQGGSPVHYVEKNARVLDNSRHEQFVRRGLDAGQKDYVGLVKVGLKDPGSFATRLDLLLELRQSLNDMCGDYSRMMRSLESTYYIGEMPHLRHTKELLDHYVFSYIKVFDSQLPDDDPNNYYMEREWRMLDPLNFKLDDVVRILAPREFHDRLRLELPNFAGALTLA